MDEVLHPGEVGVVPRRKAELPARVVVFAEPVGVVEGRVGEDEVGAEIGTEIAPEGVGLLFAEGRLRCRGWRGSSWRGTRGGVALLTVDADVPELAAVGLDEFFRLHEHAAGTAAGVVNAAFVGSQHLYEETHDFTPVLIFPGWTLKSAKAETGVVVLNDRTITDFFASRPEVLSNDQITDICSHLDQVARS